MKKLMFSLLLIAATFNATAVTYSGKATVTLKSSDNKSCAVVIATSNDLVDGLNPEYYAALNDEGKSVLLYVDYEGTRYSHFGTSETTMRNMPLVMKANSATDYRFLFSNLEGAIEIYDTKLDSVLDKSQVYNFTIEDSERDANNIVANRFIINYVAPAPTCTEVRNGLNIDQYYTICLPKAVTAANGASFWNMTNRGDGIAYLVEAELPLVAGRPYIFQAEAEELCVFYSGEDAAAGTYGALHGTFAEMDQAALDAAVAANDGSDIYLLNNNALWKVNGQSDNHLAPNRAYIVYNLLDYSVPNQVPGRRVRAIPMQGQGTTGVDNLNATEAPVKTVIDGKLYIIRGEHMFDATGRMVK